MQTTNTNKTLTNKKVLDFITITQVKATSLKELRASLIKLWSSFELTEKQTWFLTLAEESFKSNN